MIQIYAPGNRNYNRNGDAVLHPTQCDVEMNLKGNWQLILENPNDENINLITKEAVIKCDTPIGKAQRFRIYEYEKSEDGVSAKARPVFFDAAKDAFILDKRPTNKTGKEALKILMEGTGYTAETDITDVSTAYYVRKNLIETINGEEDNSFINRWGGEPVYKNEHLILNRRYGSNKGAQAAFGNNLQSISEIVNMDTVVTRIIPMAYNGHMLEGNTPWVDSPNITKYEIVYTKVIEYSDVKLQEDISSEEEEGFADLRLLRQELVRRAKQDFANGIDLPSVTYEVEVADLENTTEYEDIKDLVKIGLGDDVQAENRRLDIMTKNRCIGMTYDCVLEKNKSVVLGETQTDYFDDMASVQQKVNQSITDTGVRGEKVYGMIDLVKASMKATAETAELQKAKAILFEDKIPESPSYGAMALGTRGFMIAAERTADGKDWNWRTFGTGQGFFADLIVAGTMLYDRCRGGIAEIGGINNTSGILKILDVEGKEIGRWDKDGVKIYSGEINGPAIIAGGIGGTAGLIKILNEKGEQIGSWGKDGLNVHSGGELLSQNYEKGKQGFKLNLNNGIIEAAQFLIETAKAGRVERGFRFKDGNLEILGTNGEVTASIHCCWSYPDGSGGVPSGWTDYVAFTSGEAVDNYFGGFWVANEDKKKCGAHAADIEFKADETLEISASKSTINNKETKTGRAEFSDGTYLEFVNGYLVGGNAKAGGF